MLLSFIIVLSFIYFCNTFSSWIRSKSFCVSSISIVLAFLYHCPLLLKQVPESTICNSWISAFGRSMQQLVSMNIYPCGVFQLNRKWFKKVFNILWVKKILWNVVHGFITSSNQFKRFILGKLCLFSAHWNGHHIELVCLHLYDYLLCDSHKGVFLRCYWWKGINIFICSRL